MFDLTLQTLLTRIVVLAVILMVYGPALCLAARMLGDEGPAQDGRLTPNPMAHLDLIGGVAFLISGLGWMTPLAVTPSHFKGGVWGVVAAILLGSLALVALVWVALRLVPVAINMQSLSGGAILANSLTILASAALGFALINLLPILPFSGGMILRQLAPTLAGWLDAQRIWVGLVAAAILVTGYPQTLLVQLIRPLLATLR